jgi:hypothetical protein
MHSSYCVDCCADRHVVMFEYGNWEARKVTGPLPTANHGPRRYLLFLPLESGTETPKLARLAASDWPQIHDSDRARKLA